MSRDFKCPGTTGMADNGRRLKSNMTILFWNVNVIEIHLLLFI
jgi:hypothetical protein